MDYTKEMVDHEHAMELDRRLANTKQIHYEQKDKEVSRFLGLMQTWMMIDPRTSRFVPVWDIITFAALAFVTFVTPAGISMVEDTA